MHPDWYRLFRLFADSYNASNASQASGLAALETQVDGIDKLTARGDLLTRDASEYVRRAVGANGTIPTSDGTDWAWQSPAVSGGIETIVPATSFPAAASVDITGIPATYAYLSLEIRGAGFDTATRTVNVQVSTDNGSSFDSTAGNYFGFRVNATPTVTNNATASLLNGGNATAAQAMDASVMLERYQGGMYAHARSYFQINGVGGEQHFFTSYLGSTSAINALRVLCSGSGNFDAGTYALLGVK